jgi:4,5-dihydroxyphthalate decarboxylase
MSLPKFTAVTRTQGNNKALKDGTVKPKTCELDFIEVDPLIAAFRRQVRANEFDICELAITTYMCAKAHGKKITAIPVPLVRQFHHGAIQINKNAGIQSAKDLEGKRVGVSRGYTVTTGVWARAILQDYYGVDLKKIQFVLSGDEHVAEFKAPSNVSPIEAGKKMDEMLISGELVAAIGADVKHENVVPLIPNALEVGLEAFKRDGHYPINHLVVIRDELIEQYPDLPADIFNAFAQSKRLYVEKLKAGQIENLDAADKVHLKIMEITGGDPLPYGIEPNRKVIENLIGHAKTQGILSGNEKIEDLFAKSTLDLVG